MPLLFEKQLRELCISLLKSSGVPDDEAEIVADVLVEANLLGIDSHGLTMLPKYVRRIQLGIIIPGAKIKIVKDHPATALVDGGYNFGQVVGKRAMELAVKKAKECGIAAVSVFNTDHFGIARYYAMIASNNDMIGIVMTNGGPGMAPTGGIKPMLGTNPIAIAVPALKQNPIVLDMATTVVARAKIIHALKKCERIPLGWAQNSEGRPTTDPAEALKGALLPIGGYKGYGLALMIDILSGILAGAATGPNVVSLGVNEEAKPNIGNLMIAININNFISVDEFKRRVDEQIRDIKNSPRVPDVEGIFVPGEREFETKAKRLKEGVWIDEETWREICKGD